MKPLFVIPLLTAMMFTVMLFTACSSEQLRRTSYETLKATERQRCLNEAYSDCPRQANYEEFQRKREDELGNTATEETP